MATIERRINQKGQETFRVRLRHRAFPFESATFNNLKDAEDWAHERFRFLKVGTMFDSISASKRTFAQMIDRYKKEILPTKDTELKYTLNRAKQLEWWKKELGMYTLANIGPARIVEARNRLEVSPATANRYMAALSHVFYVAVCEWEWLKYSPMRKIRRLREPRGRTRCLNRHQTGRLLELAKESAPSEVYLLILLALSTAARKGELLDLRLEDIDFEYSKVTFRQTKNGYDRSVPLTSYTRELVHQQMLQTTDKDLLFPRGTMQMLDKSFRRMRAELGIEDFRFHDLRHTAASYLAMSGATFIEIASILGHRTLRSTMRYTHLFDSHTANLVNRMNARMLGEDPHKALFNQGDRQFSG